ncbi:MAG: ABC transporter permease [Alphaproteobacteria bacterium]
MNGKSKMSWLLVAPLLILVCVGFIIPIGYTLIKAIKNPEITAALPRTTSALENWEWDGKSPPPEAVYEALIADIEQGDRGRNYGSMTRRLNFEQSGSRSIMMKARRIADKIEAPYAVSLPEAVPEFGDGDIWQLIKQNSNPYTARYLLRAMDLTVTLDGSIERVTSDQAIFVDLFKRTFVISIWVTVLCVFLGYPTAFWMSTLSDRAAGYVMLLVLIPFWTSILVRTTAWFILLQREGPINAALLGTGLVDEPLRMIFTRFAVYIAMVHVLLPFFILPIYSVMKRLGMEYVKAAASLGAPPWRQFVTVYLPLSMPGVAAGAVIVFMLSVGFYITPALVGGLQDQMVSYYIAFYANQTINLGMASSLAVLLLLFTAATIAIAKKLLPETGSGIRA